MSDTAANANQPGWFTRLSQAFGLHREPPLERGLRMIGQRLGLDDTLQEHSMTAARFHVSPTAEMARTIYYAPDMDGQADPGEIVWVRLPTPAGATAAEERPLLVIGRARQSILALAISASEAHEHDDNWQEIGAGAWDERGRVCFVRLDVTIEVPESAIRRQGAIIPKRRFDRVAGRLRRSYGWG
ncbi:type II toxin-antitoxin system PemK/MazF family toxin [Corynebacterium choanae]|uniref:PemK-like protein n=1 Tax=Corynebacterium choanae TaxID=1862358 RepID=A0A3G6JBQ6_9CORY|nr:type II toxin-antitoxin system PemK/MazF family toxin [Corynebacterium choanae]AZA14100.1 PemK-like protein [Corynebacterium choanae]